MIAKMCVDMGDAAMGLAYTIWGLVLIKAGLYVLKTDKLTGLIKIIFDSAGA